MNKRRVSVLLIAVMALLSGCDESAQDPNVLLSEHQQDPIEALEITSDVDHSQFGYKQTFYVPIYSDIYTDRDARKVLLSATLSVRNTTFKKSLYINKIDYYDTDGALVKSYLDKPIELPAMATLNYIVEKEENKGGSGANFIIEVEGIDETVKPVIEAVMIGNFSNKGFAFSTEGTPVVH
ncbi:MULTISPECIES: DUF3124 domain-containing protein [unclassified Psychrobacter]|uniref:DUF3124 domain-containing protein n=1 Tax=unclassified Psychrobacter TaxID=196806 RepID=UPI0025B56675|nr:MULTISPECIES: DUF3124 domain-containing protein [unclassified Psychrobacter]MDN3452998.1 DUF3124 domain-containing protein [Psychrobacter sp. APC 3350]MDN3502983.1 DUF3124 domain-containing protein [Psychrobacter sp. 5A.1]